MSSTNLPPPSPPSLLTLLQVDIELAFSSHFSCVLGAFFSVSSGFQSLFRNYGHVLPTLSTNFHSTDNQPWTVLCAIFGVPTSQLNRFPHETLLHIGMHHQNLNIMLLSRRSAPGSLFCCARHDHVLMFPFDRQIILTFLKRHKSFSN